MKVLCAVLAATAVIGAGAPAYAQTVCEGDVAAAATVERAVYKTRGRDIESLLYRPTGPANGAGIVLLHSSAGLIEDVARFEAGVTQWTSRGYHVLVPGYYDVSRQNPRTHPLVFDHWQNAAEEGMKYLAREGGFSADRVGLWGFSQGGAIAMESALEDGGAAAVIVAGGAGRPGRGTPETPIMLLIGDHDPDVSIAAVREVEKLLTDRGLSITVETYAADRHELEPAQLCEAMTKSREFFDAHLLPAAN